MITFNSILLVTFLYLSLQEVFFKVLNHHFAGGIHWKLNLKVTLVF